jgi:hypothetical protein
MCRGYGNLPQYFISQATLCRYAQIRPFPSLERNLSGIFSTSYRLVALNWGTLGALGGTRTPQPEEFTLESGKLTFSSGNESSSVFRQ